MNSLRSFFVSRIGAVSVATVLVLFLLVISNVLTDKSVLNAGDSKSTANSERIAEVNESVISIYINKDDEIMYCKDQRSLQQIKDDVYLFLSAIDEAHLNAIAVEIDFHPKSSTERYVQVQEVVMEAYDQLRNNWALEHFHKQYFDLNKNELQVVRDRIPVKIVG